MTQEFSLIDRFFRRPTLRQDVALGIGDDAALLVSPNGRQLAITADTLVENIHFFADVPPADLGHKALAVNLSDLAAMGATPAWFTLALTLPRADIPWLAAFADGLFSLADQWDMALVGGDTTRGPLSITIQAVGFVSPPHALRRSGARPGDWICVSGCVGEAALGLACLQGRLTVDEVHRRHFIDRLQRPTPQVALGRLLGELATAAIDISDGLAQDLSHVLDSSGAGAILDLHALPLSPALGAVPLKRRQDAQLYGGDDYELCFTIPPNKLGELQAKIRHYGLESANNLTVIGQVMPEFGLLDSHGQPIAIRGYQHF